jgi:hypothetical protein
MILSGLYTRQEKTGTHFLLELQPPKDDSNHYGCPALVTAEITLPNDQSEVQYNLQWFDKPANRLPEALWFSFRPRARPNGKWLMDKLSECISPLEVIRNGNRKLHAVGQGIYYRDSQSALTIETLDAPLVATGERSLLNFNNRQPVLSRGMHFNLYNNQWGTNFPMWYEDDARFRFKLVFDSASPDS